MKTLKFKDTDEWLEARKGRITGTRLKDLISKDGKKKIGYYEIIAERIAIPASDENVMDRGHRLETEALELFEKRMKKKVNKDLVMMCRDDDENIAYSPDGFIGKTEDVEVKCLNSARHIEAILTGRIPSEYFYQMIQGFVVNDSLRRRYMVFYDPRMPVDFFCIPIERKDVEADIKYCLDLEREVLVDIARIERQLTF